jgi:outer membrane protein OmpA-like peptidoglycan-associated protein
MQTRALIGLTAVATAALAACATPMPNSNLEAARSEYQTAAADPLVVQAAPKEMSRAQQDIAQGDAAFKDSKDAAIVDHYAYLAHQRTQAAIEAARAVRADQATANAKTQRDRIVLAARTRQAEQATLDADVARQSALASQLQASALADQLAALQAKQTDRGMVLTLGDVLFDTGKSTLKPGAIRTVDNLATFMQQHPERKVLIEGYTDSTGSESTNDALSEQRADAVRDELERDNIPFDRVQVHGLGERYPVASNDTSSGRQQNRRVEVVFSNNDGTFQSPRS